MAQQNDLDLSPGFLEAARGQLARLKVKNTFIDVSDSDSDSLPAFGSVCSCPAGMSDFLHDEPGELPEISGPRSAPPELPRATAQLRLTRFSPVDCPCLLTSTSPKSWSSPHGNPDGSPDAFHLQDPALEERVQREDVQVSSSSQGASSCSRPMPKNVWPPIEPLEIRQPTMSLGSRVHGTGNCKPCAWFWRPQGCSNGEECGHCHLCSAAELKARKKAKKTASQKVKQQATAEAAAAALASTAAAAPGPLNP
ncbi:unnamed protein product [Durusdinium trenchii]|uniref:C3H1-type domain-containing protein n=2 Tax=Durusdinium trenchii TaxID=1381693 RepID=A0ABP0R255_9DINO